MVTAEALTKRLRAQNDWPAVVKRLEVWRIVDSVGDDALSIEIVLEDDNATEDRVRELLEFSHAVSQTARELEPGLFPYTSMVVEQLPSKARAVR